MDELRVPPGGADDRAADLSPARYGFCSILYDGTAAAEAVEPAEEPDFARDLNLDQIVAAINQGYESYGLVPHFYRPLRDVAQVAWRHEIMRDLEDAAVSQSIRAFADVMRAIRKKQAAAEKMHYALQKQRSLAEVAQIYVDGVWQLTTDMMHVRCQSRGLSAFAGFLGDYVESRPFQGLAVDVRKLASDLARICYSVLIRGDTVTVRDYAGEADLSEQVAATFARFRQDAASNYLAEFRDSANMNHIEAQILDQVAKLHPDDFRALNEFSVRHDKFLHPVIERFDREIHFYIAFLEFIRAVGKSGLPFCYPEVTTDKGAIFGRAVFDLALAARLVRQDLPVVTNDFELEGDERVFVVSGPNQGGKTTFVRTFGQLHWLAALGCPVPGRSARLLLGDRIYTHFEREEDLATLRGKLQDDLVRIHDILQRITPDSIVLMNEIFSSTTLEDAVFLATRVMRAIIATDCLCVCVTFMDELAALDRKVVSLVSTVVPSDPSRRTLKLVRRAADGRAYAFSIAEKYRLTDAWLARRLAP
jgi:hypothetical protein